MQVRIKRFDKDLPLPQGEEFEHGISKEQDKTKVAAFDFYCRESTIIPPREIRLVPINNVIAVPQGYFLMIAARSSTPWKKGLMLANGVGILDPFFSGDEDELHLLLLNITDKPVSVRRGEVLAQGIVMKHEPVQWQEVETMGTDGHGGYKTSNK